MKIVENSKEKWYYKNMQKMLGYIRRACQEFSLIESGDKIAVGVSGGKDSLVLLAGLARMRRFCEFNYELCAITLDPRFNNEDGDYSSVATLCDSLKVPFTLIRSNIAEIVFDIRKESNPCALCSKMRRGALHDTAKSLGCNKIALGHSFDDAIETFIMNLFKEGRIGCFSPKSYLSRKDITMIRPLVFAPENKIIACCRENGFKIIESACPVDKTTERQRTKDFLSQMEKSDYGFKNRIFGAMRRGGVNGWDFPKKEKTKTKRSTSESNP
ncbi:MAG: tRNA 2-thiocytidine biosynthesis TtcA family protein [Oscillospiraceae bacterium]|nr:tRNA 2-thiocytidine biosynthesis TtcA family protein [Oscillospiraceae bacterium]